MLPSPTIRFLGAILALSAAACGPTIKSSIPETASLPVSIAVLPDDEASHIPRERVALVYEALRNELRNNHFVVIDNKVVQRICSTSQCPERAKLVEAYSVEGFASLKLESFSKTDFLAGYYNALSGELTFTDTSGKALFSVNHTERERGGLLFDSGQVVQGIIDQVKQSGDDTYGKLASRFAKTIVDSLPIAARATAPESTEVYLNTADIRTLPGSSYELCAEGTPSAFASFLPNGYRSTLQEVSPGRYCSRFSTLLSFRGSQAPPEVELRSAFGNAVRRTVDFPSLPACTLENRLSLVESASELRLKVLCAAVGREKAPLLEGCAEAIPACSAEKLIVYRAPESSGPYTKVTEIRSSSAALPKADGEFQVVAVNASGAPSTPAQLARSK